MPIVDFTLTSDEVLALPLDELALLVLRDADNSREWNWRNWMNSAGHAGYRQMPEALQALAEAWGWLIQHGLVAWDPQQSSDSSFKISRKGRHLLDYGLPWLRATERLDVELVPILEHSARPQFLRGDFETAAFVAMKEVEVRVRTLAGLPNSAFGTGLMQKAFSPTGPGALFRADIEGSESVAIMNLFQGAIGLFKNPSSHRRVDLTDATEAAEIVLLADLMMRLLDRIETELQCGGGDTPDG